MINWQAKLQRLGWWLALSYPLMAVVMMIGNVTGHYRGYYAQTAGAAHLQMVAIPMMMLAPIILACTVTEW